MRFLGLAGLGAMFGASSTAYADDTTPAIATDLQGGSYYKKTLGQTTLYLVSDGGFPMDPAALFAGVPEKQLADAKQAAFISTPAVPGHVNTLLVQDGSNLILIDTGCGNNFGPTTGFLTRNLKRAGFDPAQITHVIITHAHPDHLGGLVTVDGKLAFENAVVVINKTEHAFWTGAPAFPKSTLPAEMVMSVTDIARKTLLAAKPKIQLANPGDHVGSAITLVDAPGHTPGHLALDLKSGGESLLYVTDAVHVPSLQLANPDWHVVYDTDPELAVVTRQDLLTRASRERRMIAGAHIPFPSFGHVASQEAGYRMVPIVWEW